MQKKHQSDQNNGNRFS